MKGPHGHISVNDLSDRIRFCTVLFAAGPTITKPGYARWILDDPGVNCAIPRHTLFTISVYGEDSLVLVKTESVCCVLRSKCQ